MSTRGCWFPEYVEELEDLSPAHIFQRRIHGAGYSYRQCFDGGVLNFRQYDAALSELLERHDFSVAARVAVRRDWPYRLRSRMPQKRSILRFCAHTAAIWLQSAPRQARPLH